jgi:hypothetical protein
MTAFLVFNELSALQPVPSLANARTYLEALAEVLIDQRIKGKKVLVTPTQFLQLQIAVGYSIGRWLAEHGEVDREKRLRIKTLVDRRTDYLDCVPLDEFDSGEVEYRFAGQSAHGLFVAFSVDGLAVSLQSAAQWNVASLDLEKFWIDGEDLQTRILNVLHASQVGHLEVHLEWLREREPPSPANGAELWADRHSLFPNLEFCDSVETQIRVLGGNDPRFKAVMRGLQDLQNYCDSWSTPNFDIHCFANASGESQSTLNMYSDERTFRCPDGQYRLFEWHLKRGDTRIHFFDFPEPKRILVGYAGPHLRISSE